MRTWITIASLLGASGVVLGAFGAHALKARLTPESLASWNTAVEYHLLHAVVLLVLALTASNGGLSAPWAMKLFSAGIVFFSGSIYVLVLGGPRWVGPITPVGGICLIAAWLSLLLYARSSAG
ncbi:MAG: DUF423 domain-containing protein [Deltaproteobacteria bacterium]|nr:DUF423 domain-containing protein [Deltaproteobacteria bacterium]MBW2397067.1 DUF423 domain-containing protein [Deltaproteobacteria bacterium]